MSDATHFPTDVTSAVGNGCRTNVARYAAYVAALARLVKQLRNAW